METSQNDIHIFPSSTIVHAQSVVEAVVNGDVVLMSVKLGQYYGLDAIGSTIWRRTATPVTVEALCQGLAAHYAADYPTILRDVCRLLEQMASEGLIKVEY